MNRKQQRGADRLIEEEKVTLKCTGPDGRVKWKHTTIRRTNPPLEKLARIINREEKEHDH